MIEWTSSGVPAGWVHLVRRAAERFGMPDPIPFFTDVRTGEDGDVWLDVGAGVGDWVAGWRTWLRLTRSGEPLVGVRVPSTVRLLEFQEDHLVGVERDRLDVQTVVVLPIRKESQ